MTEWTELILMTAKGKSRLQQYGAILIGYAVTIAFYHST